MTDRNHLQAGSIFPWLDPSLFTIVRSWLLILVPLVSIAAAAMFFIYYNDTRSQRTIVEQAQANLVEQQNQRMASELETVGFDLYHLARHRILLAMLEVPHNIGYKQDLQIDFQSFAIGRRLYDQIRYIDETGMEVIRINYEDGRATNVPDDQLQSKAEHAYFIETMQLKRGQIYVSPLELNIEQGQVEQPLNPVIRLATPLFDTRGRRRGIVVLNYLAANLLDEMSWESSTFPIEYMLLNEAGYWLKGPDPADEWSFMWTDGQKRVFGQRYPDAWQRITAIENGQFYTPEGLFTHQTIYPLQPIHVATTQPAPDVYYWHIVSRVSPTALNSRSQTLKRTLMAISIPLLLFFVAIAWILAQNSITGKVSDEKIRKLSQAVEASLAMTVIMDMEGTIEYVNPHFTKVSGFTAAEIIGHNAFELYIQSPAANQEMWQTLYRGQEWQTVIMSRRKNGEIYWESASISPLKDKAGNIINFIKVSEDITERIRTETQLRQNEALLRTVIDSTPDWIFIKDLDHRYQLVNQSFADSYNVGVEELIGHNGLGLGGPDELIKGDLDKGIRGFWADDQEVIESGQTKVIEIQPTEVDGQTRYVRTIRVPLKNEDGEVWGVLAFVHDVTEREQLLNEIRHSQQYLRDILDAIPNRIYIKDTAGRYIGFNKAFRDFSGMAEENLMGKTVFDIVADQAQARVYHQADLDLFHNPNAHSTRPALPMPTAPRLILF